MYSAKQCNHQGLLASLRIDLELNLYFKLGKKSHLHCFEVVLDLCTGGTPSLEGTDMTKLGLPDSASSHLSSEPDC